MSITPQGYNYGVKPNTIHPFWGGDSGDSVLTFYAVATPHVVPNTDSTFQTITLTADTDIFNLVQPPISVSANDGVYVPFVHKEKTLYLFGEATDSNVIKWTGVYSPFATEAEVRLVTTQEVSLPYVQATAEVDSNVGIPSVDVTNTNNVLNFSFKNLKGEKGDKGDTGERGAQGEQGVQGIQGEPGATPDITVNATVDATTGTPSVSVNKSGTADNPIFDLAFSGLKGESASGGGLTLTHAISDNSTSIKNIINGKEGLYHFYKTRITNYSSSSGYYKAYNMTNNTSSIHSPTVNGDIWGTELYVYYDSTQQKYLITANSDNVSISLTGDGELQYFSPIKASAVYDPESGNLNRMSFSGGTGFSDSGVAPYITWNVSAYVDLTLDNIIAIGDYTFLGEA